MKVIKTKKKAVEKSWSLPGVKLSREEFIAGIRKAEEGPFYTFEELQVMRKQWRDSKKSQ